MTQVAQRGERQTNRALPWSLILAGGDGTRLRELTRHITGTPIPKQYCRIVDDRSLLEATMARTQRLSPPERTLVVVTREHVDLAREQTSALPPANLLVQPCNRETGPGIVFSLAALARRDPDAMVAVFPSDHYVSDDRAFMAHVTRATRLAHQFPDQVMLLGVRPAQPERAYGYVRPSYPLRTEHGDRGAYGVAAFHEKPTAAEAARLVAEGALWNCFVMVFRLRTMLTLLQRTVPEEFESAWRALADCGRGHDPYDTLCSWNFSSRFLAHIPEHLIVLEVNNVQWNDWGTPESIAQTLRTLNCVPPWARGAPAHVAA